jgi:hypothetical protein
MKTTTAKKGMFGIPYDSVPLLAVAEELEAYVERGIRPGRFLMALLANDSAAAHIHAPVGAGNAIWELVEFCICELPICLCGSYPTVERWIELHHNPRARVTMADLGFRDLPWPVPATQAAA